MRFLLFFLFIPSSLFAQEKYWISFSQQATPHAIEEIESIGGIHHYTSEWLGTASFTLTEDQKEVLSENKNITKISRVRTLATHSLALDSASFSDQLKQIHAEEFANQNLSGKGIKIGIIDAGFSYADSSQSFIHLFSKNHVIAIKDFVDPDSIDFYEPKTASDNHGAFVWKAIAGVDTIDKQNLGIAQEADFYLARTEIGNKEVRIEEDNWIAAIEWMYKQGVKVVNSSLGYTTFDDKSENHLETDMNGETTPITKAAQMAVDKGMLLVISAGNLGNSPWKIISAPADARGVLTVGATDYKAWKKMGYSSVGPPFNDYLKPNVSCFSRNGTSFSAPIVAGFAACLWQKDTSLTNLEVKKIIEQSSHLYPYGNNYLGYGVPNAKKAIAIVNKNLKIMMKRPKYIVSKNKTVTIPLTETNEVSVVVFHKLNKTVVKSEKVLKFSKGDFTINVKGAKVRTRLVNKKGKLSLIVKNNSNDILFSSFSIDNKKLYEVEWKIEK